MAICKCKMCGGDLNITELDKVATCEYCGTTQTVPSADSEKKMTLFNRANRLRLNNEFDKAAALYEQIAAEFPEEAEAYWGLCLCQYGIEYVDDPATGKKIPTCHRASFEKLSKDENFVLAMEYADMIAQRQYREETREIDRINEEILSISKNETPYDIFICYKETDDLGGRTPDSVMAQDIYEALTAKGYKVFFSRISLEDKLGLQYEPYIFAALNSAKIMLSVGTKYEYFHAVWVKNEWSRFLRLAAKDKSKVLIPCYKDMDPYDMPDGFKGLQAQDLGKLGATQDLLRGIEKILPRSADPQSNPELSEKERRANGPDLIDFVRIVGARQFGDMWPQERATSRVDKSRYPCVSIQLIMRQAIGQNKLVHYGVTIYDSLNNLIFKCNSEVQLLPEHDRVAVMWGLRDRNGEVVEDGTYRLEATIDDSRVFEYSFAVIDSTQNMQQNYQFQRGGNTVQDVEKRMRANGPRLIRTIMLYGAKNETDYWPTSFPAAYVDIDRFSYLSIQIHLFRPFGYTGIAKYNYKIYDSFDNLILDENREIEVKPNYNKLALIWILRGKDGSTAPLGRYRLETWVNDSQVHEYSFVVISKKEEGINGTYGNL